MERLPIFGSNGIRGYDRAGKIKANCCNVEIKDLYSLLLLYVRPDSQQVFMSYPLFRIIILSVSLHCLVELLLLVRAARKVIPIFQAEAV